MNSLSWLIYAANTLPSFARGWSALFICADVLWIFYSVICIIDALNQEKTISVVKPALVAILLFIIALMSNFIPDRNTFYLIAASQMGEKMIQTDEFKSLQEVIDLELKSHIKGLKESFDKKK